MAIFKEITSADIKVARSFLNQLIDIIQLDISGSTTRRKYQVFVTGGIGPGITSSLFQTVFDQDFSLQTANAIFDSTLGLYYSGSTVTAAKIGQDSAGKLLFASSSMMMREKVSNYRQFSQALLGDANAQFIAPFDSTTITDAIDVGYFIAFKRLFARDQIKRETFAMRFYQSASNLENNLKLTSEAGSTIFTDIGSSANKIVSFGGNVGNIVDSSNTARTVGLMFYDRGIAVFDMAKITSGTQQVGGIIDGMTATGGSNFNAGQTPIGRIIGQSSGENLGAAVIPDLVVSASIDNIVDHICSTRFSSGSFTGITFQNVTNINSTLVFCHANADEFNYSANPTFVDSSNRIVVIDAGQEDTQQTFTFVSSIGLYDANDNLLAVAKLSRPVEKSPERDLTFRIRLDFARRINRIHCSR
jgi:hypothetical protein